MRRPTAVLVGGALLLAGCTAAPVHRPAASSAPSASASPSPTVTVPSSPQDARLLLRQSGTGARTLSVPFPGGPRKVSVRFTCVGKDKSVRVASVKGGLFVRTTGCMQGVIFGSITDRTARRDPSRIALIVEPGTTWSIEVYAGAYRMTGTGEAL